MLSKYNYYKICDNEVVIYNSLSDKLDKITLSELDILSKNTARPSISDDLFDRLYRQDMLVGKEQDESSKAITRYNKATFTKQLHIVLLVTTDCNFSCSYCYQDYEKMYIDNNFIEVFLKFIEINIHKYESAYIDWFGGEPLLMKKKIIELSNSIQNICKKNRVTYLGSITTNGFYLDERTAFSLIKSGIKFFQVTLDGDETSHNTLRKSKNGKGSYDRITRNLINIKQNLPKNVFFRIGVRNNISKLNIASSSFSFYEKYLEDDRRFSYFQYPIQNWGGTVDENFEDQLITDEIELIDSNNNFSRPYSQRLCYASKNNGFAITPDLKVYKCHHYVGSYYIPKVNLMNLYGEISKNGVLKNNEGAEIDWNYIDIGEECKKCEFLPSCMFDRCPLRKMEFTKNCKELRLKFIQRKLSKL